MLPLPHVAKLITFHRDTEMQGMISSCSRKRVEAFSHRCLPHLIIMEVAAAVVVEVVSIHYRARRRKCQTDNGTVVEESGGRE